MADMIALTGKVAVITGGGNGIGREIVRTLAALGASVGILDLDGEAGDAAAREARSSGVAAHSAKADVALEEDTQRGVEELARQLGPASILVNNAGVFPIGLVRNIRPGDLADAMAVNVGGVLNMARATLPGMVSRQGGRIVNVASWLGTRSRPQFGLYGATKAAVISLTKTMALELADEGITVNAVLPGPVAGTPMTLAAEELARARKMVPASERAGTIPLKRLATPRDVALVVAFLCSDAAQYVTGDCVRVDGGLSIATV